MNLKVEQYSDSPQSRKKLYNFYKDVYPSSPWLLDDERFNWQNLKNPFHTGGMTEVWLLYDETESLIGQNIYILYDLSIDCNNLRGYCSTNLIVKPGLVGKGHGHKLIETNENRGGVAYAVGITPASTRAFIKRGWKPVNDARLFMKIINPLPNLKYLGISTAKSILVTPILKLISAVANIRTRLISPKAPDGVTHRAIDHFEDRWDKKWSSFLRNFAIHFQRAALHLNYKYASRSDVRHHILLFEKNKKPVGYAVYRLSVNKERGIRLGRLVDLVYDPDLGAKLVNHIVKVAVSNLQREYDLDGIVAVAASPEIAKAFKINGLLFSRVQPAIIKETSFDLDKLRGNFQHLWYITLGDSDLDNYW